MTKFVANINQKNISYFDTENHGEPIIFLQGLGNNTEKKKCLTGAIPE